MEKRSSPKAERQTKLHFKSGQLVPGQETSSQRQSLVDVARETKKLLPSILSTRPDLPPKGYLYEKTEALAPKYCPHFRPTRIRVVNADTIDTAVSLTESTATTTTDKKHVCILNLANAHSAGGGWLHGALAQEEALCYRSSLSFTLKLRHYPLPDNGGIYSPFVAVIRESMADGHKLFDLSQPNRLPAVSAVSVAAIDRPKVTNGGTNYARKEDRELMKAKMRAVARMAAFNGHRRVILGALGCGAFANPNEEVADCWAEVLGEAEFGRGWWEDVVFAVLDDGGGKDGKGNFGTFFRRLDGMMI